MTSPLKPIVHEAEFQIRTYDIDSRKMATLPALVRLMQEAAMEQVIKLGISVWDLEPHDISWILMRNHMEVVRLPRLGEKIRVRTHPSGFERVYTYRDFRIFDESGEQIASSSTAWLLMNTKTRRLTRIPAFILQLEERLPAPETYLPRVNTKMEKEMAEVHWEKSFRVSWHDLDFNKHLNNTYYIQWMLESLPPRILEHKQLVDMQVQYQAEALLEDRVVSQCYEKEPGHFQHRLVKEEDGKELAYLSTIWK
ncbi:MAG: hypothetical protein HRU41_02210 [Saprospiraceae bacterium]|nr:hypothetical protein [Saprospiraceae bacterium]